MRTLIEKYMTLLKDERGVNSILLEMDHQMNDVEATMDAEKNKIQELANAIREKRKVLLLGMGASHLVNEIFSFQLRKQGFEAFAMSASEFLYNPIPIEGRLVILTSQSGESIETVRCLERLAGEALFGITLNENSTIGKRTNALIAFGGEEKAFAGTRSVTLSLALFAYVAVALGSTKQEDVKKALHFIQEENEEMELAIGALYQADTIVATGRSLFSPLAHLFSLGCEELGGRAVLFNESGQLRHGPLETLSNTSALVVFRQDGPLGELARSFNMVAKKTSCSLIVLDSSSLEPLENAITIHCPVGSDIASVLGVMDTFQSLMIAYACGKNPKTGLPKYSSKITLQE